MGSEPYHPGIGLVESFGCVGSDWDITGLELANERVAGESY